MDKKPSPGAFDAFLYQPKTPPTTPSPIKRTATNRPNLPSYNVKLEIAPDALLSVPKTETSVKKRKRSSNKLLVEEGSPLPRRRSPRTKSERVIEIAPPSPPASPETSIDPSQKQKKKRKAARPYADPSFYAHLPQNLSDVLAHDLTLLMVGLNPGVQTAITGFHFANPTNLFWPLLYSSGIIERPMKACESGTIVEEFNVGITNIVKRPTAEGSELSKEECVAGVAALEEIVRACRPRAVALTGKGIWDACFKHIHGRTIKKSDEFAFGWQKETFAKDEKNGYECPIFVTMGTSGRVAAYSPAYKREVFNELGTWVREQRRKDVKPVMNSIEEDVKGLAQRNDKNAVIWQDEKMVKGKRMEEPDEVSQFFKREDE